jgi:oligopeptide/dipeptide ABC transporter ATP-binding protein
MEERKQTELIRIKNLEVAFSVHKGGRGAKGKRAVRAVDGVTLSVYEGEVLAVVGESGCGKTTLGKAALNIIPATAGQILYRGVDLSRVKKRQMQKLRQELQLIYQDPYESLDPGQSVLETLMEPLLIHRKELSFEEKRALVLRQLEAVGLQPAERYLECYPHHLSGGERQRLSIAASMILQPRFVVADEPVSMLDVSIRAEILNLMLELQKNRNLTYLFISHDLSLTWMIADRIAVFYLGKMMELGPAEDVVHRSMHPYTRALVSVIPQMAGTQRAETRHVLVGETPSATEIPSGCRFHTRCWMYQYLGCPAVCREKEPALVGENTGHEAACHFDREGQLHV